MKEDIIAAIHQKEREVMEELRKQTNILCFGEDLGYKLRCRPRRCKKRNNMKQSTHK